MLPPFPPNFNVACAFELMPLRGWFCLCNIFPTGWGVRQIHVTRKTEMQLAINIEIGGEGGCTRNSE